MEGLQFAQVLADLSELQTAEPYSALQFLRSNSRIAEQMIRLKSEASGIPPRPKYDKLGRRITDDGRNPDLVPMTPPNPPMNAGKDLDDVTSYTSSGSGLWMSPGRGNKTPTEAGADPRSRNNATSSPSSNIDTEMERAKTLINLFEIRGQLKEQEGAGLTKARERVAAVHEKYTRFVEEQRANEPADH
ncbi:hypothetical protein BP5796_07455 [Coleophoma crateriformis]|uniref:Uncharacterized protein n=1 Tax=Coleophoma crateriformis TaxID=565419 RepID=A0A3D8RIY7_9HELO|nr:hypothetical protein BP5796_07455 [Coleophoma crateriformis]